MVENLTKHIPLTTIIISYFFICGGLYLIGFWTIFNVDVTNFISLSDIPKSFIFPFVISQGFLILSFTFNFITTPFIKDDTEIKIKKTAPLTWARAFSLLTSIEYFIIYFSIIIWYLYDNFHMQPAYWILSSIFIILLLSEKARKTPLIRQFSPYDNIRVILINSIIAVPIMSFAIGKSNSLLIYNNQKLSNVEISKGSLIIKNDRKIPLKFIGFLGDQLIVSSLDNEKIFFIKQSSFDQVEIIARTNNPKKNPH